MDTLKEYININDLGNSLAYLGIAVILFSLGKLIYKLFHRINIKDELVHKDNFAFALGYVGYFVGIIIIVGGAISGQSYGLITDIKLISIYSLVGILLLNISSKISNVLILPKFNINKEILADQNAGTGIIQASIYIANALILFGALIGDTDDILHGLTTFICYWLIGNIVLLIVTKLYNAFLKFDVHTHIEKDNVAIGISFSGVILAFGIIIMNALLDPFEDWTSTIIDVLSQVIFGIILLPILRLIADKLLLPGQNITDEIINQEKPNNGAGLIEAFAYIGTAIIITWSF